MNYIKKFISVTEPIIDRVSLNKIKIKIKLTRKNILKGLVMTLSNIIYLSISSLHLIKLDLLNHSQT